MKRIKIYPTNGIRVQNELIIGETIEQKVARMVDNQEPIKDAVPTIYQERAEGVLPAYDIRTDRFMVAIEAMGKVSNYNASEYLKTDNVGNPKEQPTEQPTETPTEPKE